MRTTRILALALLPLLLIASPAMAIDEGQTVPKLNRASISFPSNTVNLIPLTNGSGNLKGIHCRFEPPGWFRDQLIDITLDGGATTTIQPFGIDYPRDLDGASTTGFIPLNLRFESSIRVVLRRASSPAVSYSVTCVASWALD